MSRRTSSSRTATPRRQASRAAGNATSAKNAVRRKKRTASRQQQAKQAPPKGRKRSADALPGWRDLTKSNKREERRPRAVTSIDNVSTLRFGMVLLALATVFTLYIGHVHATQDVLAEVQRARRANLQLHLELNHLKGDFDRATGPSIVYQRARAMGLEEGIAYGPTIQDE